MNQRLPTYASIITHLNVNNGGLGLLHASTWAVLEIVLNMMTSCQCTSQGFQIKKDIIPITVNTSLSNIFKISDSSTSPILQRYHLLLPYIALFWCPPSSTPSDLELMFTSQISSYSTRGQIKKHCGNIILRQIHAKMNIEAWEHTHLLPSIPSPQCPTL